MKKMYKEKLNMYHFLNSKSFKTLKKKFVERTINADMKIEIEDQAKKWIESKGKHLTVKTVQVKGCCTVGVQELVAIPGKPKTLDRYNECKVDNLSIYIQKNIKIKDKITLKLSGIGFFKSIAVKGFLQ
jgi:hypothetical protein